MLTKSLVRFSVGFSNFFDFFSCPCDKLLAKFFLLQR